MEVFCRLKPGRIVAIPKPLKEYADRKQLVEEKIKAIFHFNKMHHALELMHKLLEGKTSRVRSKAQRFHNAKT